MEQGHRFYSLDSLESLLRTHLLLLLRIQVVKPLILLTLFRVNGWWLLQLKVELVQPDLQGLDFRTKRLVLRSPKPRCNQVLFNFIETVLDPRLQLLTNPSLGRAPPRTTEQAGADPPSAIVTDERRANGLVGTNDPCPMIKQHLIDVIPKQDVIALAQPVEPSSSAHLFGAPPHYRNIGHQLAQPAALRRGQAIDAASAVPGKVQYGIHAHLQGAYRHGITWCRLCAREKTQAVTEGQLALPAERCHRICPSRLRGWQLQVNQGHEGVVEKIDDGFGHRRRIIAR
ncbi:hypothetical protein D3C76_808790 [compost metagenome]